MICRHGGLTFVRHNEIRVITAKWLDRVCHDVVAKPPLKPLTGENVVPATTNWQYDTRADIHAWVAGKVPFDVRVFHPNAQSYCNSSISAGYRHHEMMKKRECGERVRDVELASFTSQVFSTTGGMDLYFISDWQAFWPVSRVGHMVPPLISWVHCVLTFSLLRSAVMCIWGHVSICLRSFFGSAEMGLAISPPDV